MLAMEKTKFFLGKCFPEITRLFRKSPFEKGGARRAGDFLKTKSLPLADSGTPFYKGRIKESSFAYF